MEKLNEKELLVAKKIVKKGLLRAAESLSFFMKESVGIEELDFQAKNFIMCPNKVGNDIHLLTTEIIGDLPGVCFLIFSKEEADKLRDIALPDDIKNNPAMAAEMNDAIMLEVDNIITASVVTEFSNILKQKIYGNVPGLTLVNNQQLQNLLLNNFKKDGFAINFKTQFISSHLNFSPEFIWLFDDKFINRIKNVALDFENVNV